MVGEAPDGVRASEREHPELFWALRGGGGNFGVVTAFEYRAQRLGPEVYHAEVMYPVEQAADVLAGWRDAFADAPDEITTAAGFWTFPAVPDLPAELHGAPFVLVIGDYAGPAAEGEKALRPLRELGTPLLDASRALPYLELQRSLDAFFPAGDRYYWKGLYLDRLDAPAIDLVVERSLAGPSARNLVVIRQLGGAIGRVPADATAFGDRSAPFHLSIDATWTEPGDDAASIAWARSFYDAARRFSSGQVYFNFAGLLEEGEQALRTSFGPNYERLVDVKTAYDPENVFRLNANIAPRS